MKNSVLFLSALLLFSCVDTRVQLKGRNGPAVEKNIEQRSVVNTEFDNSVLYQLFNQLRTDGPVIPGLLQPLVPQGMAYWEENDFMIISGYMSDNSAGALTILNMETGSLEKSYFLYNHDGTPHLGHLGGLALSHQNLWIASGPGVYFLSLERLISTEDRGKIHLPEIIETETKGSFATFSDDVLWIGEFALKNGSYPVSESHHRNARDGSSHRAWLGGYRLDAATDMIDRENSVSGKVVPDFVLSIPDKIQGAVFFENKIMLSESYGRKNYSRLFMYDSPISELSHQTEDTSNVVDRSFWFLDEKNKTGEIIVPPMSEAVVLYQNSIALLFESAADKYRDTALFPLDRIQYLPLEAFDIGNTGE